MTAAVATTHGQSMEMVERKGTRLYQWEYKIGEVLEGVLLRRGIEKFKTEDAETKKMVPKEAIGITLDTEDGRIKALAPYDVADKLSVGDVGHRVIIRFTGEESIGGGRKMKRFQVLVSRAKVVEVAADLGITDEDIPF